MLVLLLSSETLVNIGWVAGQNELLKDRRKASITFVVVLSLIVVTFYWSELSGNDQASTIPSHATNSWAPSNSGNFVIGKKVAVIIENRPSHNLIPLILHFSSVLGPSWPILLFTSLSSSNLSDSAPFNEGLSNGQFRIRSLPRDIQLTNHKAVSSFLTKPWVWEQLAPADHILLFQADSIICANAQQHVDDYLQYDMIGAPIADGAGQGYHGGLSLRNRKKMLQIVRKNNWEEAWETAQLNKAHQAENDRLVNEQIGKERLAKEMQEQPYEEHSQQQDKKQEKRQVEPGREAGQYEEAAPPTPPSHTYIFPNNPTPPCEDYEDQWFFKHLAHLPKKWNGDRGATLPSLEVAMTFAVETIYYDKPLGYHQVGLKFPDKMGEIGEWCPEYRLYTDQVFESVQ
jgi:Protein of unknown function (DUF5672)